LDQRGLFLGRRDAVAGIERPQNLDGLYVLLELLLQTAFTQPVGVGNAVTV
jgi:hypothetical protein